MLGKDAKVDIVLNSLNGEYIENSLQLLKPGGCFLEIGKRDILSYDEMRKQRPDVDYHIIAFDAMIAEEPLHYHTILDRVCQDVDCGLWKAQPVTCYDFKTHAKSTNFLKRGNRT